jgi:hypothetical protein
MRPSGFRNLGNGTPVVDSARRLFPCSSTHHDQTEDFAREAEIKSRRYSSVAGAARCSTSIVAPALGLWIPTQEPEFGQAIPSVILRSGHRVASMIIPKQVKRTIPMSKEEDNKVVVGVHPIPGLLAALPDGAIVVAARSAFTLYTGQAHRWTNEGYAAPERLHHADGLLTPPSTLMALGSRYRCSIR